VGRCGFLGCGPFFVPGRDHAEHVCDSWACLFTFYYFSKGVFSLVIRGPLWLFLIVAPEPLQCYPLGNLRGWRLLMGLSSLLVAMSFRGGRASAPAGVAPEALEEQGCSYKVFPQCFVSVRGVSFSRPQRCRAHVPTFVCVRCVSRRCSRASSPRA
jgi:hypothetical protein